MCGIIAAINTIEPNPKNKKASKKTPENVNEYIVKQYQDQYSRGQKGFGIIRIDSKQKIEVDRACEGTKFLLDLYTKESNMILAHHRHPTSTDNKLDQTHPILVENKKLKHSYLFLHNGVLTNDEELRKKHLKLGFKYNTEYLDKSYYHSEPEPKWNDSEALAVEVALFIEKQIPAIETTNIGAFIALQIDPKTEKAKQILFGRNNNPLHMSKTKGKLRISSEGEGDNIKEKILYSFDISNPTLPLIKRKLLLQEPIKEPVKETTPAYHSPYCQCATCKEKRETSIKDQLTNQTDSKTDTTPLNLPIKQEIAQNNILNKEQEVETLTSRAVRTWNFTMEGDEAYEDTYEDAPPYVDKGYISNLARELKNEIDTASATEITHIIDDALDAEVDKIAEILTEYKNSLIRNHLEKDDELFFCEQINKIIETMRVLTNVAEHDYQEKSLLEQEEDFDNSEYPTLHKFGFRTDT